MKALQIETFGNPVDVVKAVDLLDVGAPAAGEVEASARRFDSHATEAST
jgi:hypothetical protein